MSLTFIYRRLDGGAGKLLLGQLVPDGDERNSDSAAQEEGKHQGHLIGIANSERHVLREKNKTKRLWYLIFFSIAAFLLFHVSLGRKYSFEPCQETMEKVWFRAKINK